LVFAVFTGDEGDGSNGCSFTITKEPCLLEGCVYKSTTNMSPVLSQGEDNDELCFPFWWNKFNLSSIFLFELLNYIDILYS